MAYGRKISGGKYKKQNKKKKYVRPGIVRKVKLKEKKQKILRVKGGYKKNVLLSDESVNVYNPETKKSQKTKIKTVLETPANRFLARQNILIKSAIIDTEIGKAKITNRPSQEGMVQAVLIKD